MMLSDGSSVPHPQPVVAPRRLPVAIPTNLYGDLISLGSAHVMSWNKSTLSHLIFALNLRDYSFHCFSGSSNFPSS